MDWYKQFDQQIAEKLPDLRVMRDEPMSHYTSFRIGGPARRMACPDSADQFVALLDLAHAGGWNPLVIGKGTNLLVVDEGLDRLVINTALMSGIKHGDEAGVLVADAGAPLVRLADFACKLGLEGLEFAHGIPGSVGGAVCMNAGAYDGEMKQVIESVTLYFPGEGVRTLSCEEMEFSYRHSLLSDRPEVVVLAAAFRLKGGDPAAIREKMRELLARRKATQPLEFPSAGSTFKRPVGNFAGTLIEQCGLKGLTVGGAQVSEKHAGFVINQGGATCKDVTDLIALVQERVMEAKGVHLEPEVKIIRA